MTQFALATGWSEFGCVTPFSDSRIRRRNSWHTSVAPSTDIAGPAWKDKCESQLAEIRSLEVGWDGFNAAPIREDAIEFALEVLASIMLRNTPAPHFTPMSHSGLMLEWHTKGIDLEIEIEKPGSMWVSFEDSRNGEDDYEGPVTSNLGRLQGWIERISTE